MAGNRITLGVRERRTDLPNYRDHGMMVDAGLIKLVRNLQRLHGGYALVSERGLRAMMHEDTLGCSCGRCGGRGHLSGVDTLRKAMQRLEPLGYIERRQVRRGATRPDGELAQVGSLCLRVPVNRGQQRAIKARAREVDHRQGLGGRIMRAPPLHTSDVAKDMNRGAPDEPPSNGEALRRARELEVRLQEFLAQDLKPEERYGPGGKHDS